MALPLCDSVAWKCISKKTITYMLAKIHSVPLRIKAFPG